MANKQTRNNKQTSYLKMCEANKPRESEIVVVLLLEGMLSAHHNFREYDKLTD